MQNKTLEEAIQFLKYAAEALEKHCNQTTMYNAYRLNLLEQLSEDLNKQADSLREFKDFGGS